MRSSFRQVSLISHIRPHRIRTGVLRFRATFCLGGLSFLAFLVLTVTGILLLFHYQPGEKAYISVVEIATMIPYGEFIRSLHYWAGQVMVFSVFLHMARVVWHHAYRPLREKNWLIGVVLLVFTILLDFSGYLLRGNQESGAAAAVGLALLEVLPGGRIVARAFLGNPTPLNGSTLPMYVWHCFLLAGFIAVLQLWHFWRVRRDGGVRAL